MARRPREEVETRGSHENRKRIDLDVLPANPDCHPIEWLERNVHVKRIGNHCCQSMDKLLDLTFIWLGSHD